MQFSSALFFNLAQISLNSESINLSTMQPVVLAKTDPQPFQVKQAQVGGYPFLIAVIVLIGLVGLGFVFKKPLSSFIGLSGQSQEEFSVSIKISNVRTKDYFRAEVQGTVYLKIDAQEKAISLQSEDGIITNDKVASFFKDTFDTAIRQAASSKTLLEIHEKRQEFGDDVTKVLQTIVDGSCLSVKSVVIGGVDESNTYQPDNYFDAKVIKQRTGEIQTAILATRTEEAQRKPKIREQELKIQQEIRKKELEIELETQTQEANNQTKLRESQLEIEKRIQAKELEIEKELREKELEIEREIEDKELEFQKAHLDNNKTLETKKIESEIEIEDYRNTKQNQLDKKIEAEELLTTKEIEIQKAEIEKEIQLDKMAKDKEIAHHNHDFQSLQAKLQQELEKEEMQGVIQMSETEKEKLKKEKELAEAIEAITTAIEMAQVERENTKTKLIKDGRLAAEAEIIKTLAQAEETRYKAVPSTDVDRMVKLIREELIDKNKVDIVEVAKALAPQKGVLGDSSIYTFANGNGNGEDINKLMRSTSGMQLIHSLLDGKLGEMLAKTLADKNHDNHQKNGHREENGHDVQTKKTENGKKMWFF